MSTHLKTYHKSHSISNIYNKGARCRVCSDYYSADRHQHSSLCSKQNSKADTDKAILGRIAVQAQDECIRHREFENKQKGIAEIAPISG